MRKQVRTLILISITVLLLVGGLLSLLFLLPEDEEETSSETSSEPTIDVVSKSTDDKGNTIDQPVKKIEVKNQKGSYEIIEKDNQLVVAGYEDLPVGTYEFESLTRLLSSLTATRKITATNISDFGLDKPRATALVTYHDDSVISFELGNDIAGDLSCYIRLNKEGPIYTVGSSFAEQLLKKPEAYIGTTLITAPATKTDQTDSTGTVDTPILKNMKLSGTVRKDKPFAFGINDSKDKDTVFANFVYITTSPYRKGTADSVSRMAQTVTTLTAVEAVKAHPTADQLKQYGLDNPHSVCDLTLAVQSPVTTDGETDYTYYNSTKYSIKLGGKDENGNYYAMVDDYNAVFAVSSESVPWAEMQFGDAVNSLLFLRDITTVKSIQVTAKGKTNTFELTHLPDEEDNDKSMVVKVGGKTLSTPDFRSLYQVFMSIYRYGEAEKTPSGDADIVFALTPVKSNDVKVIAKFYKKDASLYTCVMSDGDVFTVKASSIDQLYAQIENYLAGREVRI